MSGQKRSHSLLEACINTCIGFFVALVTQCIVFPLFGIHITYSEQFAIGAIFTVVSIARGYLIRRLFNYLHIKEIFK